MDDACVRCDVIARQRHDRTSSRTAAASEAAENDVSYSTREQADVVTVIEGGSDSRTDGSSRACVAAGGLSPSWEAQRRMMIGRRAPATATSAATLAALRPARASLLATIVALHPNRVTATRRPKHQTDHY